LAKIKHQLLEKPKTYRYPNSYSSYANANNTAIIKFVTNVSGMSKSTAYQYYARLSNFEIFLSSEYGTNVDNLIKKTKEEFYDVYDVLSRYSIFLQNKGNISTTTLQQRVITTRNFLEYYDIDISPRKFELKVKLPQTIRRNKEALSKEDIIDILNACSDIRLKTFVTFLASTGCRAGEALSIRSKDLELDSGTYRVFIRGEYTKTRADRFVFLTSELVKQLRLWLEYKHRTRRVCYKDKNSGETITEYRTPQQDPNGLIFAVHQNYPNPDFLYGDFCAAFARTLDRIGKGSYEDNTRRRRKITLHSFRRFVKSTISDLGYGDYSEWFIGHIGSTYYRKNDKEKAELFEKIEPSLTFLDFPSLERKGADFESKIDVLEKENIALRQRDSINADAIQNLSDQLMQVVAEVQELKRGQS
jgi:integrase